MVHSALSYETHFRLGQQALAQGDAATAYTQWQQCCACLPNEKRAYRQLAHAFKSIGRLSDAERLIHTALGNNPGDPLLTNDIANIFLDRGESDRAISLFLQLAADAEHCQDLIHTLSFMSNALMAMEYSNQFTPKQKKLQAIHWGNLATKWASNLMSSIKLPELTPTTSLQGPSRIGFLSGDLCDHPVGFLLLPLLQQLPSEQTFIYDNGSRVDRTHSQLKNCAQPNHWHSIDQVSDLDTMRIILNDQLDYLIDLSGHTGGSRLRIMAHRLAKRQLSWLGFSGTTGLPSIDVVLMDQTLSEGVAGQFTEAILNLEPSRFCFRPPFAPQIHEPPSIKNGYITFGSFNNTAKYNPALLSTWAEILKKVKNSRLILKWRTFADDHYCRALFKQFEGLGISPERIELRGFSSHREMLDEYNDIDIALDTFPFTGGYTSLEALWMGVPLIALMGNTPIARQSASFLKALGHTEWVTDSHASYTNLAIAIGSTPATLREMRETLRYQIMNSELYDTGAFFRSFESTLSANFK